METNDKTSYKPMIQAVNTTIRHLKAELKSAEKRKSALYAAEEESHKAEAFRNDEAELKKYLDTGRFYMLSYSRDVLNVRIIKPKSVHCGTGHVALVADVYRVSTEGISIPFIQTFRVYELRNAMVLSPSFPFSSRRKVKIIYSKVLKTMRILNSLLENEK